MATQTNKIKLWHAWQDFNKHAKESIKLQAREIFTEINKAACSKIKSSAALFARLEKHDEAVYQNLCKIMQAYSSVIKLANMLDENSNASPLFQGICEVLSARLNEFSELNISLNAENGDPILAEKQGIIFQATVYTCNIISDAYEQFISALDGAHPAVVDILRNELFDKDSNSLKNLITNECLEDIFNHYQQALRKCITNLDDFNTRIITKSYVDLIEREYEEIGNIIKLQASALENFSEDATVLDALNILREVYQHTGATVGELQKRLSMRLIEPDYSYESFYQELELKWQSCAKNITCWHGFFDILHKETIAIFDLLRTEYGKTAYQMQRIISNDKMLADAILLQFESLKSKLEADFDCIAPVHTEPESSTLSEEDSFHLQILQGIKETIVIKIDSITESIAMLEVDSTELLKSFVAEQSIETNDDIELANNALVNTWITNTPTQDNISEFFQNAIAHDAFTSFKNRVEKLTSSYLEKANKLTLNFKKDVLLYEICTYEEILTHSVSRLSESKLDIVANAEMELRQTFSALEILLKKNNIIAIQPEAHSGFNAFEHEILVAEKAEGFKKGEIIKVINTGYKQDNTIILRANVVAAK